MLTFHFPHEGRQRTSKQTTTSSCAPSNADAGLELRVAALRALRPEARVELGLAQRDQRGLRRPRRLDLRYCTFAQLQTQNTNRCFVKHLKCKCPNFMRTALIFLYVCRVLNQINVCPDVDEISNLSEFQRLCFRSFGRSEPKWVWFAKPKYKKYITEQRKRSQQ